MARDRDHFELGRWQEQLPRRKQGGGGRQARRADHATHGQALDQQVSDLQARLEGRLRARPARVNPKLIFKLQLKQGYRELADDDIRKLGLVALGRSEQGLLVVFPDDAAVAELRRRVREYAGLAADGHTYAELDAIESVGELTMDDKIGRRLREQPLLAGEVAPLDIELWHSGDRTEARAQVEEVRALLRDLNLPVTDDYVGAGLCVMRARVNAQALERLMDSSVDYIKQIDRRPSPTFELGTLAYLNAEELEAMMEPPADDLVGVVVIDSGVASAHPLLGPVIADAQTAPGTGNPDGAGDVDTRSPGHGTSVAGIAAYSDIGECLQSGRFVPSALIFSGRVTDANSEYDPDFLVEHQLEQLVDYFLTTYPSAKVINISLGDASRVYSNNEYQFRFAAAIDELAYKHRDREIVFVVSAGNTLVDLAEGEAALRHYPDWSDETATRIIDPATSAIALTVGSIAYGDGAGLQGEEIDRTGRGVASERDWPSPFTRRGPGVNGSIKPEVVDYGGDLYFVDGRLSLGRRSGVPTTSSQFAPPTGRLLRTSAGTSFAAPKVANLAARLFREFPDASSNLIRCLIAASAQIPTSRPEVLRELLDHDSEILRTYGYGKADFERARWSAQNDVMLLAEEFIELDAFALYELPKLPPEFLETRGERRITVTLAFDPPTRHTRLDSYLGVGMEAHIFRNRTAEQVKEAIRAFTQEEREELARQQNVELRSVTLPSRGNMAGEMPHLVAMVPGVNVRKKGTLQRASFDIGSSRWQYDGEPLILAVVCRREWAPETVTHQRYATVVSMSHSAATVNLHDHVRAQLRLSQRARVRQ